MEPLEPRYALSGVPSLVADINLLPRSGDPHLSPAAVANSVTLTTATSQAIQVFTAADAQHGVELWTTDGTPGGTRLLKDIWPGTTGSSPTNLASVGGMVYFAARDPVRGRELWKTDGTAAGTVLVKNIDAADTSGPEPQDGNPAGLVALPSGSVLFVAEQRDPLTAVITRQLWKTDGTDAGTVPVISLLNAGLALDPQMLTTFGTRALFSGRIQSGPSVLWITDGTSENTVPVRTSTADVIVNPGTFTVIDGPDVTSPFVIFTADDGFNGRTIWRYDSTNGPGLATSFGVTPGAGSITEMVRYGTTAVFAGDNGDGGGPRLWRTNGAEGGTNEFRIPASPSFLPVTNPAHLTVAGTKLFFTADGLPGETSLWVSDGTDFGTVRLGSSLSGVERLVARGSDVLFVNFDGQSRELWKSDGTSLGIVREINPGPGDAFPAGPVDAVTFGDELLFAADDGVHGTELWKTDGTAAGTQLVRDINTATADGVAPTGFTASVRATAVEGDTVWFVADDGTHGAELWRRSGVAAPVMVADITPGPASSALSRFTVSGGKLFFTAAAGTIGTIGTGTSPGGLPSLALWVSDGTAAGTFKLADQVRGSLTTPPGSSATRSIAPFAGGVIFAAADTTHGTEPWFSDGTATGTKLLADLADTGATAGSNGDSSPEWFAPLGGEVFFVAADGAGDRQIWKTDGTAAGTVRVTSLPQPVAPTGLAAFGGNVVFAWASSPGDVEPWITDTTSGQMRKVADINPAGSSNPTGFVEVGGRLFFTADDGVHGDEPWVTDGVTDTRLLMDINPGSGGSAAGAGSNGLVPVSGVGRRTPGVVFTADAGTGPSLWTSDGTPEDTAPLPLAEGVGSGSPGNVLGAGGMLYFTADLGGQRVLFESDGTAAGGRVVELSPGVAGSRAVALAATDAALLFSADDGVTGAELWELPFAAAPPPDTIAPAVAIESSVSQLQPGGQATITFTVSEAGTGFTNATVQVTGGTLTGFTGNGTTFTASFTAGLSATSASIAVPFGAFTDGAGNPNVAATLLIEITGGADTTAPTVAIESSVSQLRSGETATITFTFSEPVDGFAAADVLTTLGTLSGFVQQSPAAYTAVFTPSAGMSGVASLTVAAGAFTDAAGNGNTVGASRQIAVDTAAPTVSIDVAPSSVPAFGTATVTFTLSEPVSGFTAADVQVTGGTLSGFTGAGTIYTATLLPVAVPVPGPGLVSIAAGGFADGAGNVNEAAEASYVVDGWSYDFTPPTVAITASAPGVSLGQTVTLTFTLSEPCIGFSAAAVFASLGTISDFAGSGLVYTATYTPPIGFGSVVQFAVPAAGFTDVAGNPNAFSYELCDVNTIVPEMTISTTLQSGQILAAGRATEISFAVREPTVDFDAGDVDVTGGVLSGFTGSGTNYRAVLTPLADFTGVATVTVPAGRFTGVPRGQAAGNANAAATLSPWLPVDTRLPTIAIAANTSQLLVGQTATVALTLSEPAAAFSPSMIRAVGGTLSGFSGAGTSYTAVFTPQAGFLGAGEVSVAAGAFADVAGNVNVQPAAVGFVIDTQSPTAVHATPLPAGFHKTGAALGFELLMSEPVTVVGTPRVPIFVGTTPRQAVYVGSPDGSRLRFAYTVQPGDNTPVGDRTGPRVAGAIDLAGGSIRDPLGNDVLVTLPAVPGTDVVVDTTPPTVAVTSSRSLLGAGKTSVITFTLSEPSPDFGRGCVTTTGGTLSGFTGSGTAYTAWFTPQPNLTGTAVVQVDVGRFADRAGNADTVAARRAIAVDTALRFAAGTDGQSAVWDREFAYRAASATVILLPLPASQAAFFAPRSTLSITPNGATRSIVATVNASGYDAATGSVVVTLDRNVPVTKTAGFGTLVLGGIVPPGARLLAGVSGAVVHDYAAADLLRAGYSAAFVTRFQGGLRTAAADLDDNGFADLIVAPGGVPNLPDPLAPGRRLADAFGSSLRTVAIFDGSPQPAWAPVRLDVGPVLGAATRGGFQVATGNIVADASGSATLELIVASGTRLAVYEVRVAAAAARPVIDPVPIRVIELGAGRTATGVAAGRLFMDDPYDDIVVAATTASGRVAGTTTVTVLAGAALDVVRSFPVSSRVEAGPNRLLTDIFGFGASLAVGDIDGNGRNDLVLGAGAGGLGNFRVLANEVVTANPVQPAFSAAITTQLGAGGTFAQYRPPTRAWRPTGGPDYFTPGAVTGPTGQGFNAPVSVRVVNVSTTGSARAEIFAALGATNQTANTVKRFLFTGRGGWTSAAAFDLLPSSATDSRFRRGAGVRLG